MSDLVTLAKLSVVWLLLSTKIEVYLSCCKNTEEWSQTGKTMISFQIKWHIRWVSRNESNSENLKRGKVHIREQEEILPRSGYEEEQFAFLESWRFFSVSGIGLIHEVAVFTKQIMGSDLFVPCGYFMYLSLCLSFFEFYLILSNT